MSREMVACVTSKKVAIASCVHPFRYNSATFRRRCAAFNLSFVSFMLQLSFICSPP